DVQQICTWLGLPPGCWPPDHYTLLGLPPCEPDIERIEQKIHERLMRLRCYQLSNPALATEAMTCLAKAFDCLTNEQCKKASAARWLRNHAICQIAASLPVVLGRAGARHPPRSFRTGVVDTQVGPRLGPRR